MVVKIKTNIVKRGNSHYINLPQVMTRDSNYPFKNGDETVMEIRGTELVIRKKAPKEEIEA